MKIQIRENVFETNSSSTHCIAIKKGDTLILPYDKTITVNSYVPSYREYDDIHDASYRLSYLYYSILYNCDSDEERDKYYLLMLSYLDSLGIKLIVEEPDPCDCEGECECIFNTDYELEENKLGITVPSYDELTTEDMINVSSILNDAYIFNLFIFGGNTVCIHTSDSYQDKDVFDLIASNRDYNERYGLSEDNEIFRHEDPSNTENGYVFNYNNYLELS